MSEMKFYPPQSLSVMKFFLDTLWDYRQGKFSAFGENELGAYLGYLFGDPATPTDWRECYKIVYGKSETNLESQEGVFTLMLEFAAQYAYKQIYRVNELVEYLHRIRYRPNDHTTEWSWWNQAVQKTVQGDVPQYIISIHQIMRKLLYVRNEVPSI
jgi:hypothetical protein